MSPQQRFSEFEAKTWSFQKPVKIYWMQHDIPYIKAQTDRDLFYATGLVQAHLRLSQLEIFRRLSQGRLSELVGGKALPMDVFFRTLDLGKAHKEILAAMSPETRLYMEAFLEGLNDYGAQVKVLPFDLRALGVEEIRPWTLKDLIYVHRLMGVDVNWKLLGDQIQALNESSLSDFDQFWVKWVLPVFKQKKLSLQLTDYLSEAGSNAFALSGKVTKSQKPLVAGDPHLGITLPNFWLFIYQESPSFKTLGISMPSFPLPAMGRTPNLAWTGTNLWGVNSYLYVLDSKDLEKAQKRSEFIRVRFGRDREVKILDTAYGPVVSSTEFFQSRKPLALHWSGHQVSSEFEALIKANKAQNVKEFKDAFKDYGVVALNYVAADRFGDITKIHVTKLPRLRRPNKKFLQAKDNPVETYLNVYDLPEEKNPQRGWVVSANEPVEGIDACFFCAPHGRADRISSLIDQKKGKLELKDVQAIHLDTYLDVARQVVEIWSFYFKKFGIIEDPKISSLWTWDFVFSKDSVPAYYFENLDVFFAREVFVAKNLSSQQIKVLFSHESWREKSIQMFQTFSSSLQERTLKRLNQKAAGLEEKKWGEAHQLVLGHPFSNIPVLGSYFTAYDGPYAGTLGTVFKSSYNPNGEGFTTAFGANLRVIYDFSSEDENYAVLLGGQDGFFKSTSYTDQLDLWLEGKYLKLPFSEQAIKSQAARLTLLH